MKNLNIIAPICSTGYGITSVNLIKQLLNKYNVTIFPVSQKFSVETQEDYELIYPLIDKNKQFDNDAPCLKVWHQFDLATRIGKNKYVAFPIFELDILEKFEINHINSADHVAVCSKWAQQILINNNITKPISVVPLGVDQDIFDETKYEKASNDKYIFSNIGKWEHRKSHDILIECFNRAFTEKDDVELWLVTENPFLSKEQNNYWHSLVMNSKLKNKIKMFGRLATQTDVAKLIQYTHCGIYISKAEGWNLELLETISMNKPVIATNYSGHTEFCNTHNSYLVDIENTEKAIDNQWFFGTGNWASLDKKEKDQIIDYMKYVYTNRIDHNPGYLETKQIYSWKNSAEAVSQCISSI